MRKKWKRYKNRILSFSLALIISVTSVLPCMSVEASGASSEVEDLIEKGVFVDKNGDGKIQFNEVNPLKLIWSAFSRVGYWFSLGKEAVLEMKDTYQSWLNIGGEEILGYLGDDGLVYLNENTWHTVHNFANALIEDEGYKVYPALPTDPMFYLDYYGFGSSLSAASLNEFMEFMQNQYGTPVQFTGSSIVFYLSESDYKENIDSVVYVIDSLKIKTFVIEKGEFIEVNCASGHYSRTLGKEFKAPIMWLGGDNTNYLCRDAFNGLIGKKCFVFNSAASALKYYSYDRDSYVFNEEFVDTGIHPDVLNGKDWFNVNSSGHSAIKDSVLGGYGSDSSFDESSVNSIVKDYTEEVRSSLEFIEQEQVEQTTYLKAIYELLKEWLEKIFNKIPEEDEDHDFEDTSNNQSDKLDDLIQDSQVEKPDIDNTNQLIDENLDMGNVEEYGTLLSVFTGNQRILSFILISLTAALIAYVFYGKR